MRNLTRRIATLVAVLTLAACASGTIVVVRQPPPPPPPRPRIEPLEITLGRPLRGHLIVQTNRPSYVALFEIVPDRGVALLAPAYAHQRSWVLVGLNWVPVSWSVQSALYYGRPSTTSVPARWVYAIASDEPLHLPDEAFQPGYLRRVLGPVAYRASNPYVTMRAIARAFVPAVVDEAWAEDAYAIPATHSSDPHRTVRIYCANRTVYEVPEEMAHRAWCPVQRAPGSTTVRSAPTRPDSVVASNGQRARRLPSSWPVRTPIDRVQEPPRTENPPVTTDNSPPRTDPPNTDVKDAKDVKESKEPKDWKDLVKERLRNKGNAHGHTDDPNVKGRGIENEKRDTPPQNDPPREPRIETPVVDKTPPVEKVEEKQAKQEEKQIRHEEKQEEKELRREEKQEEKVEKREEKAEKQEEKVEKREEKNDKPVTVEPPPPPPEAPPAQREEPKTENKEEKKQEPKEEKKQEPKEEKKPDTKEEKKEHKGKP